MGELTPAEWQAVQERLEAKKVANGTAGPGGHARLAARRRGRLVRCTECGWKGKQQSGYGRRLRHIGCPDCGGRLHVANWAGFTPEAT